MSFLLGWPPGLAEEAAERDPTGGLLVAGVLQDVHDPAHLPPDLLHLLPTEEMQEPLHTANDKVPQQKHGVCAHTSPQSFGGIPELGNAKEVLSRQEEHPAAGSAGALRIGALWDALLQVHPKMHLQGLF